MAVHGSSQNTAAKAMPKPAAKSAPGPNLVARAQAWRSRQEGPPTGETTLTFGKHAGSSFESVFATDPSYVVWCSARLQRESGENRRQWLDYIETRLAEEEATATAEEAELVDGVEEPQTFDVGGDAPTEEAVGGMGERVAAIEGRLGRLEGILAHIVNLARAWLEGLLIGPTTLLTGPTTRMP